MGKILFEGYVNMAYSRVASIPITQKKETPPDANATKAFCWESPQELQEATFITLAMLPLFFSPNYTL